MKKLNELKKQMNELAKEKGREDPRVLELSQEIDKIIFEILKGDVDNG